MASSSSAFELFFIILNRHVTVSLSKHGGFAVPNVRTIIEETLSRAHDIIKKDPQVLMRQQPMKELLDEVIQLSSAHEYGELFHHSALQATSLFDVCLPIHYVAYLRMSDLVQMFLEYFPESACEFSIRELSSPYSGISKFCALHVAVMQMGEDQYGESGEDVIETILDKCPRAARVMNDVGHLGIHGSCFSQQSLSLFRMIYNAYPHGITIKDTKGNLPLHLALGSNTSMDIIMELLDKYPQAAKVMDNDDNLPLHHIFSRPSENALTLRDILLVIKKTNYYGLFHPYIADNFDRQKPIWASGLTSFMHILRQIQKELDEYGPYSTTDLHLLYLFNNKPAGEVYPYILHDAMGKIPAYFFRFLLRPNFHRIDLNLKDKQGNTALMIAIQQASKTYNRRYWHAYYKQIITGIFAASCNMSDNVMDAIAFYLVDTNGRNLLHIAAQEGLPWLRLKDILDGNVHAISSSDSGDKYGLLPFMLATNLSSSFELLRTKPDVLVELGF